MVHIGFCDQRASPLQSEGLQFNPQRVKLTDFVHIKRRYESSFVLDTAHESFMLKRDESLTHRGRSDVHLLCNLAFHDHCSRLQHAREEGILQSSDYAFS